MSLRRQFVIQSFALLIVLVMASTARASIGFQPVSADELKMTSEPLAPGAPAIILYRQVDRDDNGRFFQAGTQFASGGDPGRFEDNYVRIKILTEEGRKYANVEILFDPEMETIVTMRARTIRPDGSTVEFGGQVFEKTVFKTRGRKYVAKAFTLPDVQVGSIIEYYYTTNFNRDWILFSKWVLSNDLFTKRAKFSLRPWRAEESLSSIRWTLHLPAGAPEPNKGPMTSYGWKLATSPLSTGRTICPPKTSSSRG